MDEGSAVARNQLLHMNIHIDELDPRRGVLDLLRRLRPQWKTQDIQMKASVCVSRIFITCESLLIFFFYSMNVSPLVFWLCH